MKSLQILLWLVGFLGVNNLSAQVGYQKDSLQIKVYTEAEYRNGLITEVKVKKIFCDYCTEYQKVLIEDEAERRTYIESREKGNRISNGTFKHAVYIRIAKTDFAEMKSDSLTNNN